MATTTDVEILKFQADFGDLQAKLKDLEAQLRKLGKAEEEVVDTQKKGNTELLTASQKRKAALTAEQAELKKLQVALKGAFTAADIDKFNTAITKTKNNISLLKGEAGGLDKATSGLKSQFAGLGAGIAAAFTVDAVIAFGKASIDAFLEAEENANRLKNSLREVGEDGEIAFARLIKQSAELAQTGKTIFSDDDIQRAQAQLANFGLTADEIEKLIPKLADYASATKQNIVDAAGKVGNALLGQGREFKKYGIFVDATKTSTENLNVVMEGFVQFQGRAAKETQTLTGQLADQKREADELQETLGSMLAPAYVAVKTAAFNFTIALLNSFSAAGRLQNSLTSLGVSASQTAKLIDAGFNAKGQSEATVETVRNLKNLASIIEFYNAGIKDGTLSTVDYYKAIQNLNQLITIQNTQTKDGQIAQKLLQNGIVELTETYKALNPALKESIDLSKKSTEELLKLQAASSDDRDLSKLIEREIAARKKLDEAIRKTAEAEKKANDKRLEEANRMAGAIKEGNEKIQEDATKQVEVNAKATLKSNDELIKEQQAQNLAAAQQNLDSFDENEKKKTELLEKEIADREALNQQAQQAAVQAANEIADAIFQIQQNNLERSQKAETEALQTEKDKALSNKRLTEAQKDQINKEFAAKELILAKKQFEEKKRLSISQAIIQGALAVVTALATASDIYAGLILAALVAATTASEIAVIESQKFAKGKKENQKGGPAYVGEQGMEFMYVPDNAMIVDARKTNRHKALINAMMDGNLDDYLEKSFVLPRLQSHLKTFETNKEKSFSNNVAKALIFHGLTPLQAEKIRRKGITINNADVIIEGIVNGLKNVNDPRQRI